MPNLDISMKRTSCAKVMLAAVLALAVSIAPSKAQTNVYTNPVGFYSLAEGNGSPGGYNIVGLPMQQMRLDQGLVTAVSSNVLSVNCGTCVSNNYGILNGQTYYVELETGNGYGQFFGIISNDTAGDITVSDPGENLTTINGGVAAGDAYRIYPYWRLRDIFGPASACTLQSGTKVTSADNVLVWNGSSFTTTFPSSGAGLWVVNGSPNDNFPISPDDALFVLRRSATQTNTLLVGEVRVTNTTSVLQSGYNFLCLSYPASTTLDNSGLTNSATGFHGGTKVTTADNVLFWNGSSFDTAFFSTGSHQWVLNGSPTNGYVIAPNIGFFVLNKTTGGYWNKVLPYSP